MKNTITLLITLTALLELGVSAKANGYCVPGTCDSVMSWTPYSLEQGYVYNPGTYQNYSAVPYDKHYGRPYVDQSYAWLQFNEQSSTLNSWAGYPQGPTQNLYAMALDAQRRGAFAYAGLLRQLSVSQIDIESRIGSLQVTASTQAQLGDMIAAKQERIRKGYADLQPQYTELMRRRRDLKGQDEIHQYNIEAASYTAKLRQLRREEAQVNMMMRSGARF